MTSSSLPSPAEISAHTKMRIVTRCLSDYPSIEITTKVDQMYEDGRDEAGYPILKLDQTVTADVFLIDDPDLCGLLPSKVWYDDTHGFVLLYYVSPMLPDRVKPFKGKRVLVFHIPALLQPVEYDAAAHVFIDQIQTPSGTRLWFMFSEDEAGGMLEHNPFTRSNAAEDLLPDVPQELLFYTE